MRKLTLLFIICIVPACMTPIGIYGPGTETIVSTSDLTFEANGTDKMDVTATVNPLSENYSGDIGLQVQGASKVVNKGNMKRRRVVGRSLSEASVFLGQYQMEPQGDAEPRADHGINYHSVEGGGFIHDLFRSMGLDKDKAYAPTVRSDNETQ